MKKYIAIWVVSILLCLSLAQLYAQTSDPTGGTGSVVAIKSATANAAAPTKIEGAPSSLWVDLGGLLHVAVDAFNFLLAGEDLANDLLKVSGGKARMVTFSSVTSATTSAVTAVPTGTKTLTAQIINGTSETKAATIDIYGNMISSTTGGQKVCTITLPSTVTTLQLQDSCPQTAINWLFWYYTVTVYTSASSAPVTVYAIH